MARQQKNIRRCKYCGAKTHRMHWVGENPTLCPVCHSGLGFYESNHGGLKRGRIAALREQLIQQLRGA